MFEYDKDRIYDSAEEAYGVEVVQKARELSEKACRLVRERGIRLPRGPGDTSDMYKVIAGRVIAFTTNDKVPGAMIDVRLDYTEHQHRIRPPVYRGMVEDHQVISIDVDRLDECLHQLQIATVLDELANV
jgi:hypothetical protein